MTEKFYFDFNQIPQTGVQEPDLTASGIARSDSNIAIRRTVGMKIANFGALEVGARLSTDYTRTNTMAFSSKDDLSDVNVLTEDTGIGSNVRLFGITVNHNPYLSGSTVKLTRDDQFVRMTMSMDSGTSSAAGQIDLPKFDVMDTKDSTAAGIIATTNYDMKNWPAEGWRTFGGKYDFLPYVG